MSSKLLSIATIAFASLALSLPTTGCSGTDVETGDEQNATSKKAQFELFQSEADGQWYFHMLSGNGQVMVRSEGYTTESAAKDGVKSVQKNGKKSERFEILEAVDGQSYFNLTATNGQVIATSELYTTKSNATKARDRVMSALIAGSTVKNAELEGTGFQTFKCGASNKEHCFRLRAENGEIVLQSEAYKTEAAALDGIESVRKNGTIAGQYEVVLSQSSSGAWFRLRAESAVALEGQEIIGRSQVYKTEDSAREGIKVVMKLLGSSGECLFADDGTYSIFDEEAHLSYGELVDLNAESDLTSLQHNQIWAAVNHHFPSDFDTDEQDVFSFFDEDSLIMREIEHLGSGRKYTAFEFTSGDTPLATVFEAGSEEIIVLTAGDQDIETCTVK